MENNFYEFSLQPKNLKFQKFLAILFDVLSIVQMLLLLFIIIFYFVIELTSVMLGILATMVIFMLIRNCFYNFYDYNFYDGEFKFIKLVNNKYRKKVAIFNNKEVISVGKVNGETFKKYFRDGTTRRLYAKNRFDLTDNDIVILFLQNNKYNLIILENDENFTSYVIRSVGVKKLDNDFISYVKEGGLKNNG